MILALGAWLVAGAVHAAFMSRHASQALGPRAPLDARIFAGTLATIGSLALVLHATALVIGLSLPAVLVGLGLWHAALALLVGVPRPRRADPRVVSAAWWGEWVMLSIVGAILLTWIGQASQSVEALGPDNAHYHLPVALNLAAGATLFDLPATPHLYPMAGSTLTAWFVLPFGTPLVADLAMALPFVLTLASINLIVRCTTGLSGTAWGTWLGLALFGAPMLRMTSLGAADLWLASGFAAMLALSVQAWATGAWRAIDVILGAAALGLVLGSKTTGAPAAVLLLAGIAVVTVLMRVAGGGQRMEWPERWPSLLAVCAIVTLGTGGIWLVRNWILFGSPVAPSGIELFGVTIVGGDMHQRTTYLSVLGELETDRFRLWPSARHWIVQWFGIWYLPALWAIGLLVADLAGTARMRVQDRRWWGRLGLLLVVLGAGTALVWLLIGAPWTALDRSRGLTLRYALPIAVLLPVCAFAGLFPMGAPWYRRTHWRWLATLLFAIGAGTVFIPAASAENIAGRPLPVPALGWAWLPISLALGFVAGAGRPRGPRRLGILALAMLLGGWLPVLLVRHDVALASETARLEREEAAYAAGTAPVSAWREVFLALRVGERAAGRQCQARRFFALTRFDEPLALQPPTFTSEVYFAGRDVAAASRATPLSACDYVVTAPAMLETDRGRALMEALGGGNPARVVAETADVRVLAFER